MLTSLVLLMTLLAGDNYVKPLLVINAMRSTQAGARNSHSCAFM